MFAFLLPLGVVNAVVPEPASDERPLVFLVIAAVIGGVLIARLT